jgi:DNA invertase Pin-like site-specific DNA recombinase
VSGVTSRLSDKLSESGRPKRAGIYVRISHDDEGREGAGLGVQRQGKDCSELGDRAGWTVVRTFTDNDISAVGGKVRPAFLELLDAIRSGEIDGVIVWHLDRLFRTLTDLDTYAKVVAAHDVPTITCKSGELQMHTATGRMIATILGAVFRHEVEHQQERQVSEKAQQRAAGLKASSIRPYGYRWAGKGQLAIVEEEARHIVDAYKAVKAGTPVYAIAKAMNAAGAVTIHGRPWEQRTVRQMLMRASNAGLIDYGGKITKGKWAPIVSRKEWEAVTAILGSESRRVTPGPKPAHLCSGVLRCGKCKGRAFKIVKRPPDGRTVYLCRLCFGTQRDEAGVDALVVAAIILLLSKAENRAALHPTIDLAALDAERTGLRARLNALAGDVRLDDEQVAIRSVPLRKRLGEIDQQIATANRASVVGDLEGDAEAWWFSLTLERQRAVVAALLTVAFKADGPRGRLRKGAPRVPPESIDIEWTELVCRS